MGRTRRKSRRTPRKRNVIDKHEKSYAPHACDGYVAIVPTLPGCHTQGDTLTEVMQNAKEAIDLYIETLTEQEKKTF